MYEKIKNGFTLIEALIVVVIIGIIAAIAIPQFLGSKVDSERATCQTNLNILQTAISHYKFINSAIPADVAALVATDLLEVAPKCPGGGTYSIDQGTGLVSCDSVDGHTLP